MERIKLSKLRLLPDNPRQINDENFERLKRDLQDDPEFLDKRPVLVNKTDEGLIVYAGNMRTRAAIDLGWEDIPCIVDENLSDEVMRKRALRDNQEYGEWDMDILANEWSLELESLDLPELTAPKLDEIGQGTDFELPSGDRAPFRQMTFTLADEQADTIEMALKTSKALGEIETYDNENSNGNALYRIVKEWVEAQKS